ncbi:Hypothetical protein CAP_2985 [Chondromyces apiculatus DSM 436]|uniref:Uncharacterized protein n=1 Tax=Chondromyces apiculatus DSM 436 TaxID=1192034 RepID=A0A017TA44_9BACT|nr:Hypothetical protein CAP_2985 [Chondromyces apiculatus DSM 436]
MQRDLRASSMADSAPRSMADSAALQGERHASGDLDISGD